MTQRPIVAYLSLKGMSAREVHDDIVATIGPDAVPYSSVTRYLREARFPPSKPGHHPADVQRDRDLDDSDQAILAALEDSPFASVRQLSRLTHPPSTTVYRLSPSYTIVGICGASPSMGATCSVRCAKVRESQSVSETIANANARSPARSSMAWHRHPRRVLILPEYMSTDYEFVWLPRDEKFPKKNDTQFNQKNSYSRSFGIRAGCI
jgi:hypothetical protein